MAHAERAVDEAAADTHDLDVGIVIRTVVADLFQTAQRRKVADRIGKDRLARERHAGGDRSHILLGNAGIQKLIREAFPKRFEHAETEIARDELDVRIRLGQRHQRFDKGISHFPSSPPKKLG